MALIPLGILASSGGVSQSWFATLASAGTDQAYGVYTNASNDIFLGAYTVYSTRASGFAAKILADGTAVSWQKVMSNGSTENYGYQMTANDTYVFVMGQDASSYGTLGQFSNSGTLNWSRRVIGGAGVCYVRDAAVDASGNVFITGQFYNDNQGQATNPFIAKYDSSGTLQWSRGVDWGATGQGWGISVDSSSNVYVGIQLSGAGGYLMKLNSSGTQQWAKVVAKSASDAIWSVDSDSSGNTWTFGQQASPSYTAIAKFDSSGANSWQRTLSTQTYQANTVGSVDSSGNSYVAFGSTAGTVYVAKYNTSGTIQWQRSVALTGGTLTLKGIYADSSGQLVVTGTTNDYDIFIMKVPTDGSKTGTYVVGSKTYVYAASSLTDAAGGATISSGGVNATPYATFVSSNPSYTASTTSLTLTKTSA